MTDREKMLLSDYYDLWVEGYTSDEIRDTLGLTKATFDKHTSYFFAYCRDRLRKDNTLSLMLSDTPVNVQLTDERRAEFLRYCTADLGFAKAAKLLGIPLITVTNVWFVQDPIFKEEAENAALRADANVILALHDRAIGTEVPVTSHTKSTGEKVLDTGKKVSYTISDTTTESTKVFPGDVTAQRVWVINRQSEKWSADGESNKKSNKGKILDALSQLFEE